MRTSSLIYWFILPRLLLAPTIWFSPDRKWWNHKCSQNNMEMLWVLFWLWFHHTYDSVQDCRFLISLGGQSLTLLRHVHMTPALHTALSLVETSLNSVVFYYFIITVQYPRRQCWFQGICAQAYCGMVFVHLFYLLIGYQVLTYYTVYASHVTVSYDRMCVCAIIRHHQWDVN